MAKVIGFKIFDIVFALIIFERNWGFFIDRYSMIRHRQYWSSNNLCDYSSNLYNECCAAVIDHFDGPIENGRMI